MRTNNILCCISGAGYTWVLKFMHNVQLSYLCICGYHNIIVLHLYNYRCWQLCAECLAFLTFRINNNSRPYAIILLNSFLFVCVKSVEFSEGRDVDVSGYHVWDSSSRWAELQWVVSHVCVLLLLLLLLGFCVSFLRPASLAARVQAAVFSRRGSCGRHGFNSHGNWATRGLADAAKRTKTKHAKSPVASASRPVTTRIGSAQSDEFAHHAACVNCSIFLFFCCMSELN